MMLWKPVIIISLQFVGTASMKCLLSQLASIGVFHAIKSPSLGNYSNTMRFHPQELLLLRDMVNHQTKPITN